MYCATDVSFSEGSLRLKIKCWVHHLVLNKFSNLIFSLKKAFGSVFMRHKKLISLLLRSS